MKITRVAIIQEDLCIGCTKCIQACPVDAILGAHQYMHAVIASECIGCELCVAPCPMDCISMVTIPETEMERLQKVKQAKERVQYRKLRLSQEDEQKDTQELSISSKKQAIAEMIARAKAKKGLPLKGNE